MKKIYSIPTIAFALLVLTACEAKTPEEIKQDKAMQTCLDADKSKQYFLAFGLKKNDQIKFCKKEISQSTTRGNGLFKDYR